MSMPPEPVTGFCILPRPATMLQDGGPDGGAVAGAGLGELAEGGGVEVESLDGDPHLVGADRRGRRRAGGPPGAARPRGSSTRCTPSARSGRSAHESLPSHPFVAEEPIASGAIRRRFSRRVTRVAESRSATEAGGTVLEQPYEYSARELVEPDWRRLPGFADVTERAVAQRPVAARQLREEPPSAPRGLRRPARRVASTPTSRPTRPAAPRCRCSCRRRCSTRWCPVAVPTTAAMLADPVRRYMLPVASDRLPGAAASHPYAARDSLHEHEMWAVEGLTHRYPTKVLAELLSTCPQYCGHCTRMDLVGNSTPAVPKLKFELKPVDRQGLMLDYLRAHPRRPRRRRLRRRRGQPAVQEPRGVRRRPARDRVGPRHPAGDQGAHGHAAALAAGRRRRGHDPAGDDRPGPRASPSPSTRT